MILFDIKSFPNGLDLAAWIDLIERSNIALFDSENKGEIPFVSGRETDNISFIDIGNMTERDLKEIALYLNNRNTEDQEKAKQQIEIARVNNEKLIKYLRELNEGYK